MKPCRWLSLLLALFLMLPMLAASGEVLFPRDEYVLAMNEYYAKDYAEATKHFKNAGNYEDAGMWAYYCEAISLVILADTGATDDGTGQHPIDSARARFELLAGQHFQNAASWAAYCTGRQHEAERNLEKASMHYQMCCVHDSIVRYLKCEHELDILKSEGSVRASMPDAHLPFADLYTQGMNAYYRKEYDTAENYFCLAGNYEDAQLWRCYCLAIHLLVTEQPEKILEPVPTGDTSSTSVQPEVTKESAVGVARALFDLLAALNFRDSAAWATYCQARQFEASNSLNQAMAHYKEIFILDSFGRYLDLLRKQNK